MPASLPSVSSRRGARRPRRPRALLGPFALRAHPRGRPQGTPAPRGPAREEGPRLGHSSASAPRVQLSGGEEPLAALVERRDEFAHALARLGDRLKDRRDFVPGPVGPQPWRRRGHAPGLSGSAPGLADLAHRPSAPSRSALLTTKMSPISITPALMVWMSSPDQGIATRTTVSASRAMSTSDWPMPTVSTRRGRSPPPRGP